MILLPGRKAFYRAAGPGKEPENRHGCGFRVTCRGRKFLQIWLMAASAALFSASAAQAQLRAGKTSISEFVTSPFPLDGSSAAATEYFNEKDGTKRGRKTATGRIYWENETYNDQRVLLHIPAKFDIRKPGVILVYFHGHGAILERDIRDRQQLPEQVSASVANAVLVDKTNVKDFMK